MHKLCILQCTWFFFCLSGWLTPLNKVAFWIMMLDKVSAMNQSVVVLVFGTSDMVWNQSWKHFKKNCDIKDSLRFTYRLHNELQQCIFFKTEYPAKRMSSCAAFKTPKPRFEYNLHCLQFFSSQEYFCPNVKCLHICPFCLL